MKIYTPVLKFGILAYRKATEIDTIIVHHTADTDAHQSAESIHAYHKSIGWAGIGYHYVIRKNGAIQKGRPNLAVGAHAVDNNTHSIGIVLCGNFEQESPTTDQLAALRSLVKMLRGSYKIKRVVGHRDVDATACPGENLYRHVRTL